MQDSNDAPYTTDGGEEYHRAVHSDQLDRPQVFEAKAALAQHRYFRQLPEGCRVLEFGVGLGTNLAALENVERFGHDASSFALDVASRSGIRTLASLDDVMEAAPFDVVVCRHVLEHVPAPMETLETMIRCLSRDGKLLIILPVERSGRRFRRVPTPDDNRHLYAWNLQHIVNLFSLAGLEIERHEYLRYSMQSRLVFVLQRFGVRPYSKLVSLAGFLRRQAEIVVWAKPTASHPK